VVVVSVMCAMQS